MKYQKNAATGKVVAFLQAAGGSTTKNSPQLAKELGLNLATLRDAIVRLQRMEVLSLRDEENRVKLLSQAQ